MRTTLLYGLMCILSGCGLYPFRPLSYDKPPGIYVVLNFPNDQPTITITFIPDHTSHRFQLGPWDHSPSSQHFWQNFKQHFRESYGHVTWQQEGRVSLFCRRLCEFNYKLPSHPHGLSVGSHLFPKITSELPVYLRFHHHVSKSYTCYCASNHTCTQPQFSSLQHQLTWWKPYYKEVFPNWDIPTTWVITQELDHNRLHQLQKHFKRFIAQLKTKGISHITLFIAPSGSIESPMVLRDQHWMIIPYDQLIKQPQKAFESVFRAMASTIRR